MKSIILALFLFISIPFTAYADEPTVPPSTLVSASQPDTMITDNQKPITVSAENTKFIIKLPANPTTGYSWFTKNFDHDLLTLNKQVYVAPKSNLVGQGGHTLWYFTVKKDAFHAAYTTEIQLVYARPWEIKKGQVTAFTVVILPGMAGNGA